MVKVTFISDMTTKERAFGCEPRLMNYDVKFYTLNDSEAKIIAEAGDTEYLVVDAMAKISNQLISDMPSLRLIQSEGVGYQGIDTAFAKSKGITVCNNKGINNTAVAEAAVLLILACLKNINTGRTAMYEGRQIDVKMASFGVVRELSQCTVGLVGFGDIARETARLLNAFGAKVVYSNRTRYIEAEKTYNAKYVSLDELLEISDFVSLHLAVCDDTKEIVNAEFISKMKKDAYLINTSRGDLVDNESLYKALVNNRIAGAGLDVISPEPVSADNILLDEKIKDKLVLMPHIAGITNLTVRKIYVNSYENILKTVNGEKPNNIVN